MPSPLPRGWWPCFDAGRLSRSDHDSELSAARSYDRAMIALQRLGACNYPLDDYATSVDAELASLPAGEVIRTLRASACVRRAPGSAAQAVGSDSALLSIASRLAEAVAEEAATLALSRPPVVTPPRQAQGTKRPHAGGDHATPTVMPPGLCRSERRKRRATQRLQSCDSPQSSSGSEETTPSPQAGVNELLASMVGIMAATTTTLTRSKSATSLQPLFLSAGARAQQAPVQRQRGAARRSFLLPRRSPFQ
jgi:hypothetical protein